MNIFSCCCLDNDDKNNEYEEPLSYEKYGIVIIDISRSEINDDEQNTHLKNDESLNNSTTNPSDELIIQEVITHIELFMPIQPDCEYYENIGLYKPIPIRKIPTIEKFIDTMNVPSTLSSSLPSRLPSSIPSSLSKYSDPIPIDYTKTYL